MKKNAGRALTLSAALALALGNFLYEPARALAGESGLEEQTSETAAAKGSASENNAVREASRHLLSSGQIILLCWINCMQASYGRLIMWSRDWKAETGRTSQRPEQRALPLPAI